MVTASANRSVLWLTLGTLMVGLSGYLFLALVGHGRFDADSRSALTSTYLIVSILGPGVFVATEQETSRLVSAARATQRRWGPVVRRLSVISGVLALLALLILAASAPTLLSRVLNSDIGLLAALGLSVVGSAAVYLVRGLTGGAQRFGRYAATLMIDGGTRVVGCLVLAIGGSNLPAAYGLALCAGPAVAALATGFGGTSRTQQDAALSHPMTTTSVPAPPWSGLVRSTGWLLIASVIAMVLANLSGVLTSAALPDNKALAAGFATALVLTRIPLLAMGPVQAFVLPKLAAAASTRRMKDFRRDLQRGLFAVLALGGLSVLCLAALGRWVIALVFGAETDTSSSGTLVLLGCSAVMLMALSLLQPALIALECHLALVVGWLAGAVLFLGCFLLPVDPISRAVVAQLIGPASTLLIHLLVIRRVIRRQAVGETT